MYQQHICPSNATYMLHKFMYRYLTTRSLHVPHMNLMQSTMLQQALVYICDFLGMLDQFGGLTKVTIYPTCATLL